MKSNGMEYMKPRGLPADGPHKIGGMRGGAPPHVEFAKEASRNYHGVISRSCYGFPRTKWGASEVCSDKPSDHNDIDFHRREGELVVDEDDIGSITSKLGFMGSDTVLLDADVLESFSRIGDSLYTEVLEAGLSGMQFAAHNCFEYPRMTLENNSLTSQPPQYFDPGFVESGLYRYMMKNSPWDEYFDHG